MRWLPVQCPTSHIAFYLGNAEEQQVDEQDLLYNLRIAVIIIQKPCSSILLQAQYDLLPSSFNTEPVAQVSNIHSP
jgi:hypothetical protein